MQPFDPLDALRSVGTVAWYVASGRLHHRRDRVGTVLSTADGQRFEVYRETTRDASGGRADEGGAVLAFRFHLRFMPRPIRPLAARVFEPLSVLTTPFFAGLPGFRTKLWLFDHDTGDYMGVYQWESADAAERYARSLRQLIEALSVPGSVAYEVRANATLDDYVRVRRVSAPTA